MLKHNYEKTHKWYCQLSQYHCWNIQCKNGYQAITLEWHRAVGPYFYIMSLWVSPNYYKILGQPPCAILEQLKNNHFLSPLALYDDTMKKPFHCSIIQWMTKNDQKWSKKSYTMPLYIVNRRYRVKWQASYKDLSQAPAPRKRPFQTSLLDAI